VLAAIPHKVRQQVILLYQEQQTLHSNLSKRIRLFLTHFPKGECAAVILAIKDKKRNQYNLWYSFF
tara:strand:- start:8241 stop:8438 length:198 start_codon:yes stop_codon:yes gene_type:complete